MTIPQTRLVNTDIDTTDSFLDDHHGAKVPQHDHLRARDFDVNRAKGLV
jgi:hypothetical protein